MKDIEKTVFIDPISAELSVITLKFMFLLKGWRVIERLLP